MAWLGLCLALACNGDDSGTGDMSGSGDGSSGGASTSTTSAGSASMSASATTSGGGVSDSQSNSTDPSGSASDSKGSGSSSTGEESASASGSTGEATDSMGGSGGSTGTTGEPIACADYQDQKSCEADPNCQAVSGTTFVYIISAWCLGEGAYLGCIDADMICEGEPYTVCKGDKKYQLDGLCAPEGAIPCADPPGGPEWKTCP
ncbi:MAG: hypothetical protein H6710_11270 [Myxococcales bacterium]|nr:hypothetical protein [Myxococcales bacterium]